MRQVKIKFALSLLACTVLAACTTTKEMAATEATATTAQLAQNHQAFADSIRKSESQRLAAQEVERPFIAGKTMPVAREVSMPAQLRRPTAVTALFQRAPVDLQTALRQLSEATSLTVTATSDAFMSPGAFAPKTGAAAPIAPPPMVVLQAQNVPIWQLFDDVARQIGASWRPTPTGAEFFRVETRIFPLAAIAQVAESSASLGRTGGKDGMFVSQSQSSFSTKGQNLIAGIKTSVDALLSTGGKAIISDEHQTLIVTDTPANVERIAEYIGKTNKVMSRRIRVLVEAIELTAKDGSENAIDWNIIYNAANSAAALSPASLAGLAAGSLTLTQQTGAFAGSNVMIKMLSEVGTIVNRRTFPFLTTSGRPVTQALRSTFSYVDQVQATAVASSANTLSSAPTVTQKDETVGTFLTVVPTAKSDGTIFLSIAFDVTQAQPLVPFTTGTGATAVTVQQKTIDGNGMIQELPVRSGQTVIVGGINSYIGHDLARRLAPGAPMLLGGSDKTNLTRVQMVLLVTAVAEEGV